MNQEKAQERIKELKGYYAHLGTFILVNLFLIMIKVMTNSDDGGDYWFVYPLFGWGIGLSIHTFTTFFARHDWEERKMQELTGWSMTQEELERLSQRTENLVTILSNVNWEKIDPDLVETKDKLLDARQQMIEMRDYGVANTVTEKSKSEVIKEIEKLEAFVTSSKFNFYDQAAK